MGKDSQHSRKREIGAVLLVILALLLLLSLVSYDPFDVGNAAASGRKTISNFIGPVGAWLGYVTFGTLGLGAYVLMLALAGLGLALVLGREDLFGARIGASVMLLVTTSCLLHLAGLEHARKALNLPDAGGFVGLFIAGDLAEKFLGTVGSWIIFIGAYLISLILLINFRPSYWVAITVGAAQDYWARRHGTAKSDVRGELSAQERELRMKGFETDRELAKKEREARKLEAEKERKEEVKIDRPEPKITDRTLPQTAANAEPVAAAKKPFMMDKLAEKMAAKSEKETAAPSATPAAAAAVVAPTTASSTSVPSTPAAPKPKPAPKHEASVLGSSGAVAGEEYVLPPVDLLERPPALAQRAKIEDLAASLKILCETLADFGIEVQPGDVTKGHAITRFEVYPAPGVKVEKISALSNNIALAMKASSVRILTPVPGKDTVGIEVPNSSTTTVYLRDILESPDWAASKAKIPVALGRDVEGRPIIGDLTEMPHMLIAGATGSGKTVCVNAILATLLYKFTAEDLRLVLIDPKMVEMQQYNALPHLIVPVVTDSKKVPLALRWVINEMEKRFQIFAKVGVRNIASFNGRVKKPKAPPPPDSLDKEGGPQQELKIEVPRDFDLIIPEKLPFIIVVIDELADLMHTSAADVEMAVARLTAMARAVGIHLIIATQRPSVDVVTGVIKSNIPARIAFQVASKQDSRVILDANGADKLLGKGDMLYLPPGSPKLIRAQGTLVLDEEIHRIVDYIAARAKPHFEVEIHQRLQKSSGSSLAEEEADEADEELVEQCIEVIRQTNRASVSILQRRLRIGYTRAARIMDLLEERGIVGPNRGAEPRDILIDLDGKVPAES